MEVMRNRLGTKLQSCGLGDRWSWALLRSIGWGLAGGGRAVQPRGLQGFRPELGIERKCEEK